MARRIFPAAAAVALVLAVAGCGGSTSSSASTATTIAGPTVVITNFAFAPKAVTVKAGTTITWRNEDVAVHDVKFASSAISLSPLLTANSNHSSWSHTFTAPGNYPYICGIHPFMTGTVTVTP